MDRRFLVKKSLIILHFFLTEINATFTFQSILEIANKPGNKNKKSVSVKRHHDLENGLKGFKEIESLRNNNTCKFHY